MKTVTILKRARKIIENPNAWCKGHGAMTKTYKPTETNSRSAALFCAWGAIDRASGSGWNINAIATFREVLPHQYGGSIFDWNDAPRRTHKQVITAFDRAIARAEREQRS